MSKKQEISQLLIETSDLLNNETSLNESIIITDPNFAYLNYLLLCGGCYVIGSLIGSVKKIKQNIAFANTSTQIDMNDLHELLQFINSNSEQIRQIIEKHNIKNYKIINKDYNPSSKDEKITKNKAFFIRHIFAEIKISKNIEDVNKLASNLNSLIKELQSLLNHKILRKYKLQICGSIMINDRYTYKIMLFKSTQVVNKESIYFKGLYKKYWNSYMKRLNKKKTDIDDLNNQLD